MSLSATTRTSLNGCQSNANSNSSLPLLGAQALPKLPGYNFIELNEPLSYRKSHLLTFNGQLPYISKQGNAPERRAPVREAFSKGVPGAVRDGETSNESRSRMLLREQLRILNCYPEWKKCLSGRVARFSCVLLDSLGTELAQDAFPLVLMYEQRRQPTDFFSPDTKTVMQRGVILNYFLEDGTIQITEVLEARSTAPKRFLSRTVIDDLGLSTIMENGSRLKIFDHVLAVTGCDAFTHELLTRLDLGTPPAIREFDRSTQEANRRNQNTLLQHPAHSTTPVTEQRWYRSAANRSFLENDKKVLRFHALWWSSGNALRESKPYSTASHSAPTHRVFQLLYFLADGTICINEVQASTAAASFFKRGFLPKLDPQDGVVSMIQRLDTGAPERDVMHYTDRDLLIGSTVSVLGRPFLLYDADAFTISYVSDVLKRDIRITPDWNLDTSLLNTLPFFTANGHHPQVSRILNNRAQDGQHCPQHKTVTSAATVATCPKGCDSMDEADIIRFRATLWNPQPENMGRVFVVCFYCSDETLGIFEQDVPNSGHTAGRFLSRQRVLLHHCNQGCPRARTEKDSHNPLMYLSLKDLNVGATVNVYGTLFYLEGMDERSEHVFQRQCQKDGIQDLNIHPQHERRAKEILQRLRVILRMKFTYATDTYRAYAIRFGGMRCGRGGDRPLRVGDRGMTLDMIRGMLELHNLLENVDVFERDLVTRAVLTILDSDGDGFVGLHDFEKNLIESDPHKAPIATTAATEMEPFPVQAECTNSEPPNAHKVADRKTEEPRIHATNLCSVGDPNTAQRQRKQDAERRAITQAFTGALERRQYRVVDIFRLMSMHSKDARIGLSEFTRVLQDQLQMCLSASQLNILYQIFFGSNQNDASGDAITMDKGAPYNAKSRITLSEFSKSLMRMTTI